MQKKEQLHRLIKSLTKTEKRYFTLFASTSGQPSNYLKLFRAIDKQINYDEKVIKDVFKSSTFIKQLHVTKINLTELILKSLRNYHGERSVHNRLMNKVMDIHLLYEKELYDACGNRIEHAIAAAEKFENFGLLHELLSLKRKLLVATNPTDTGKLERILKKEDEVLDALKTINTYWKYSFSIQVNPLPSAGKSLLSHLPLQAKILHYHSAHVHHFLKGNLAQAERSVSSLIHLLDENFEKINHDPRSYVAALSNKIGLLLQLKKWNEIPALIAKMKQVSNTVNNASKGYSLRLRCRIYNIEMEYYRDTNQWNKAVSLVPEIAQFMTDKGSLISEDYVLLFCYQCAYVFFKRKEFSVSLKWLNRIQNDTFSQVRQDILVFCRLLNIVVHYELKNYTVIAYALESTRRFLKKENLLEKFQSDFMALFRKLLAAPETEHKKLLKSARQNFSGHKIQQALDYLDLRTWIDEKTK